MAVVVVVPHNNDKSSKATLLPFQQSLLHATVACLAMRLKLLAMSHFLPRSITVSMTSSSLRFHVHNVLRVRLRSVVDHELPMILPTRNVRHQRVVQQSNVALGP